MTTYVLVHGAWGGAHTWRSVRPLLHAAGHAVFTPALTGIGERVHLISPQIGLTTHVDDVVNQVVYEDLDDLVLLGFSYGGMVVTGALTHIADRVRELVYLDAFVPTDGQSVADIGGLPHDGPPGVDPSWSIPPSPRSFDDPAEATFGEPRRTAQPVRTFTEPVRLAGPLEEIGVGLTYVKATRDERTSDRPDPFWEAADRARDHPAWRYHEIDSNHMVPQNRPAELAEVLFSLS
ncbi:MAG: alpha/beta hydrolase [Ilumatobacteraceae bacterium]|nr:alpha/beta hydrolase [Ilumatobacteraceae bacterium]